MCLLFNARSLNNKLSEFQLLLNTSAYKLVFVTETWFQDDVTDSMISNGDRYHIIRCDRSGRRGGGVCALVCKDIKYSRVSLTDVQRQLLIQSCCDLICFDVIWLNFKYRFILSREIKAFPGTIHHFSEMGVARVMVHISLERWRYSGHFGV